MNESDLASNWPLEELRQIPDLELIMMAETYAEEVESEWENIQKVFKVHPELFPVIDRDIFMKMYNYACTRCFGWTLPSTMMVPMADFLNHHPVDTQYEIYQKEKHMVAASVDSQGYHTKKRRNIDFSDLYPNFDEMSADEKEKIGGSADKLDKMVIPRKQLLEESEEKASQGKDPWDMGYWSSDVEEDNDTEEEEYDDEDYDDEDDEEDEGDPSAKILKEKEMSKLNPVEA